MKTLVENKMTQKFHLILVVSSVAFFAFAGVAGAMSEVEEVVEQLQQIVDDNPDTSLADKAEDVLSKALTAHYELTKIPPDYQAAVGNMEGAVGDLEAAVNDELLDADQGVEQMNLLTCAAWQLGAGAIFQAIDCEADADKIADAEQALYEGDQLWLDGAYKDAMNKYKDALAKAEGAISGPVDPLAGLVIQNMVSQDGDLMGKSVFHYNAVTGGFDILVSLWGLGTQQLYGMFLCVHDVVGTILDVDDLGSFSTNGEKKAILYYYWIVDGFYEDYGIAIAELNDGGGSSLCSYTPNLPEEDLWKLDLYPGYCPGLPGYDY